MTKKLLLTFLLVLGIILILAACAPAAAPAPTIADTSGGATENIDAKALVDAQCSSCHSLDRVESKKADVAGWTKIVDRMISKGSNITFSAAEKAAVITYLADTYK